MRASAAGLRARMRWRCAGVTENRIVSEPEKNAERAKSAMNSNVCDSTVIFAVNFTRKRRSKSMRPRFAGIQPEKNSATRASSSAGSVTVLTVAGIDLRKVEP